MPDGAEHTNTVIERTIEGLGLDYKLVFPLTMLKGDHCEIWRSSNDPKRNSCRNRRCRRQEKLGQRVTRPGVKLAAVATRNEQSAREAAEASVLIAGFPILSR